ncbi:response regulator transcription factor [Noviherbaspirillum malthae]|jgi:FixJ family two-component response regulator|uniref:response regulator transcription factor n=1 Tax=Noviherbaspirillum malthae TaxID=1260987 RepID=UPI00188E59EC|nr:response regulator [Noviherbaspirillum malthae]
MEKLVFLVDDDEAVRVSVTRLLRSAGHAVKVFATAEEFLQESSHASPACLILDMRLSSASGFDVIDALAHKGISLPIIFISGYGSIPMTVRAMKAGAQEFLTKPVDSEQLLQAVDEALARAEADFETHRDLMESTQRYATLTQREREVLGLAIGGLMNKQIAMELGIQEVTAKVHKQKVMEKMGTRNLIDLVKVAQRLNIPSTRNRYTP